MSPLQINMLLTVYAMVQDYRDLQLNRQHANSSAVAEALDEFVKLGLTEERCPLDEWKAMTPDDRIAQHGITPKGQAMVNHLMAVQVPICVWVQPADLVECQKQS